MRSLIHCTIGGFVALSIFAATPALADFRIIKWPTTGVCQIYDFGWGFKPIPPDYKVVSRSYATFGDAAAAKARIWKRARCTI
ncbi:MAG TPA: hypothetical protein VFB45_23165 [Pseudolabrys sp.]|nr:hypothetical protein [Pseudolabrys sp.]